MTGQQLKAFRIAEGFTQTELAHWLGTNSKYMISRWENGKIPVPKWVELRINSELKK